MNPPSVRLILDGFLWAALKRSREPRTESAMRCCAAMGRRRRRIAPEE